MSSLWAVVASEDHDGIVFDAGFLDRVEDLASAIVHLGETIGPIAVPRLPGKLRVRQCWHVKEGERNVGEKWSAAVGGSSNEFNGARRDLLFHGSPMIQIQLSDLPRLFPLERLIDGFSGNQLRVPALLCAD